MSNYAYHFNVSRAVQNGNVYYQASIPFRVLATMLKLDDCEDVNNRSQRVLSKPRARAVAKYLVDNNRSNVDVGFTVIPPVVGIIEGECEFKSVELDGFEGIGKLAVDINSKIVLFDGQTRSVGIKEALQELPLLASDSVSIMLFTDLSIEQRKQAFHDINFTQKTPARALCIAYNSRDPLDKLVVDIFSKSKVRHLIEYEKNSVSGKSEKVYSLKTLLDFSKLAIDDEHSPERYEFLGYFVTLWLKTFPVETKINLSAMRGKDIGEATAAVREDYIFVHAVFIKALGMLAGQLQEYYDWSDYLRRLKVEDFKRDDEWLNICVDGNGKMISNQKAVRLTLYKIMDLCQLELKSDQLKDRIKLNDEIIQRLGGE